jgi:hypothetical protein
MKIKMKKTVVVAGSDKPVPRGVVVQSDNPATIAEYKALVQAGYAAETNEKPTDPEKWPSTGVGGNTPQVSGIKPKGDDPDAEFNTLLAGNIESISAGLGSYNEAQLQRIAELEASKDGKNRVGVASAVEAAIAALQSGDDAE